jgi:hypothetical protein
MKKDREYLIYLQLELIFTFLSCHFLEPRDLQDTISITEIEELNKMTETWKATEVIYEMVRERNYVFHTIQLLLKNDSTFEAIKSLTALLTHLENLSMND